MSRKKPARESYIRYIRLLKGMSIGQLSYETKITATMLNCYEYGTIKCLEEPAKKIAKAFGMEKEWRKFLTDGKYLPIKKYFEEECYA